MLCRLHEHHFQQWYFELRAGFNILFYGFGSKRRILTRFVTEYLGDAPVVVINGYFPTLTARHIFQKVLVEGLQLPSAGPPHLTDQLALIRDYFAQPDCPWPCLYLLIHNIDGPSLRSERMQNTLSQLAACSPHVHLIASIDHIQAPLLWDSVRLSQYQWVWHDLTTYDPYTAETSFENSLMVQRQEVSATGIQYVLASLTSNAKGVFRVLANYQIDIERSSGSTAGGNGLSYPTFYAKCREKFLASSDVAFRAQLTEFRDHKIIQSRKATDGNGDVLYIPLDVDTLMAILENMP
ncbi:origin recognition complex, subunit 2 [Dimargaris cristalligena]|uniref:Origin recognition complex subunit 2 n=1 Tax=Dimargaris cristalligena TaxID=215637 RepID=A0A4P9ZTL6_9FUNG|nr:origin recognition complex, subunit 2 [Dimargaris cristalligena]|eukprot:RKP36924.1 origin recognition complex, subunit 2 [Dimargaris cristalligena]